MEGSGNDQTWDRVTLEMQVTLINDIIWCPSASGWRLHTLVDYLEFYGHLFWRVILNTGVISDVGFD